MINYFDEACICGSCNKNMKKVNQIVCDECDKETGN